MSSLTPKNWKAEKWSRKPSFMSVPEVLKYAKAWSYIDQYGFRYNVNVVKFKETCGVPTKERSNVFFHILRHWILFHNFHLLNYFYIMICHWNTLTCLVKTVVKELSFTQHIWKFCIFWSFWRQINSIFMSQWRITSSLFCCQCKMFSDNIKLCLNLMT